MSELNQIYKAKSTLQKIASGINPVDGKSIKDDSIMNNPDIIRCFFFISNILDDILNDVYRKRNMKPFRITEEQKNMIKLPDGNIGITDFAKGINTVLDIDIKKLTGIDINKKLKKLNILSEMKTEDGRTTTITNCNSSQYGFETEKRTYNGQEYDKIVMNDTGKQYLINNLEAIMS